MRLDKDNYYLKIAEAVLNRSTCLRRRYGAVIVKDDEIISTGYNGAARGMPNCDELGYCFREREQIPHGERYESCRSVHGEANAIISASRRDMLGAVLYLTGKEADGSPVCKRLIINAGISTVVVLGSDNEIKRTSVKDWVNYA